MKQIVWIAYGWLIFGLAACSASDHPPAALPPLLQNAEAGSGWGSACPPRNESERKVMETSKLAVSPQVEQRLREEFPPGSDENRLIAALTEQRFELVAPCETDHSIRRARFIQKGAGILPYDTSATIYWKIDGQNRIVWAKGFLSYSGL